MEQIIFRNSTGKTVVLGDDAPFILRKLEGYGAVDISIQSQQSPYQDGETYTGNTLRPRYPTLEIMILAENQEEMSKLRRDLLQVFNPKLGEGTLIYECGNIKRIIKALPELAPVFPDSGVFKDTMQQAMVGLYCPIPFLLDEYETSKEITTWIGGLSFPFSLPFTLRQRGETRQSIYNDGDVETPVEIIFRGPALNPKVTNHTTGEFIRIKRELTSNDVLYITTHFGDKKVEIERHGTRENAFHYIDLDSTFFSLEVGDNLIEYTTESELISQGVEIRYHNRYLGV